MTAYYNEHEPFAADWLNNLSDAGEIAPGPVDSRDIQDVTPDELVRYRQCHFFAGIGGWSLALRLAGWPDDVPVWTGSCPCRPFSVAGKRRGEDDERHLWPVFAKLIEKCRPPFVFGEQVASPAGRKWLSGVRADLEALGYAVGDSDLCAAGVAAPHARQRVYWVGHSSGETGWRDARAVLRAKAEGNQERVVDGCLPDRSQPASAPLTEGVVDASGSRLEGHRGHGDDWSESGRQYQEEGRPVAATGFWDRFDVVPYGEGEFRRIPAIESGILPLAHGLPRSVGPLLAELRGMDASSVRSARGSRTGRIKGYGNAIVPQVAAQFIAASVEAINETTT